VAEAPRFEVTARIGSGGMGDVFLARMEGTGSGEWVALKRIRREVADDLQLQLQFEREARICACLAHENVVALRAFGRDDAGPYLALEYVDGTSAAKLVKAFRARAQHLPLPAAMSIARDAGSGLLYAHGAPLQEGQVGLIHRDVTPENVLLSRSGVAKLTDFGIAKAVGGTSLTQTGTVKGKFAYMAPELFEGRDADPSTDVFSFAATLYFLLTGVAPFRGHTEAEVVRSVLTSVPPRVSSLREGVPPAIDAWIAGALSKRRSERGDLGAFLQDSVALVASAPEGGRRAVAQALKTFPEGEWTTPAPSGSLRPPTQRVVALPAGVRGRAITLGAACAVLALAVGVAVNRRTPPPEAPVAVPAAPVPVPPPTPLASSEPPVESPTSVRSPPVRAPEVRSPSPHRASGKRAASAREVVSGSGASAVAGAPRPPESPSAVASPPPVQEGKVWIKVHPWAHVFFDGKARGTTPLEAFSSAPGEHSVILVNEELKVRRSEHVTVTPGETTELRLDLSAP
jgi:hypothetical protein